MPSNAQPYQQQEGGASAKCRLSLLLAGCTPERLASFSVDSLAATHRVKFADVAQMLADARERRAGKPDASRIGEAIAYVRGSSGLESLSCYVLAAKFNLWPGTAETIIAKEHDRRAR